MVEAYWQIGKRIVEQEQRGKDRADYGTQLINHCRLTSQKNMAKDFLPSHYIFTVSSILRFLKYSLHRGEF